MPNSNSKTVNTKSFFKDNLITIRPRPQTSINQRKKEINSRPRASSITKITFGESANLIIKEEDEDDDDEIKDLYREKFSDISSSSNSSKKSNKSERSSQNSNKKSYIPKKNRLVKDKVVFKINDLYEKSIANLDHVSPKYGFKNNSLGNIE